MDTFGKTSTDLPSIIELFDFALSRYNIVDIKKAFGVYLNSNTNFPKPADIIKIIDPPKEWCLQKFLAIKEEKALGKFILSKDEEYYKSYLNRDLKGW